MSSRVSLKASYGVLVAALDRRTGWEVLRRVLAWVSLVVSDRGCGRNVLRKVSPGVWLRVSLKVPYGVLPLLRTYIFRLFYA